MKITRGTLVGLIVLAVAGLAAVAWAVVVPRPALYVVGLIACAPVIGALLVRRKLLAGAVAVLVPVAAIAIPRAVLSAQVPSDVLWSAQIADKQPESLKLQTWVVGDHLYVAGENEPMHSYDRSNGHLLGTYPAATVDHAAVAADGSVVGWTSENDKQQVTYYSPDGKVRWTRAHQGWTQIDRYPAWTPVVAAAGGVVVLADCDVAKLPVGLCTWSGVDAAGKTRWSHSTNWRPAESKSATLVSSRTLPVLPSVVLLRAGAQYVVLDAADGRVAQQRPWLVYTRTAVQADLALFAEQDGKECRLVGYRVTGQAFATKGLPCLQDGPGPMRVIGDRAYLFTDSAQVTVSLKDGSWRALTGVSGYTDPTSSTAFGPDVLVRRTDRTLTATDAGNGAVLWTKKLPGNVRGVLVDNGGVYVESEPAEHNPMWSRSDQRDNYSQLTALDAHTGRGTSSILRGAGRVYGGSAIGPGLALAESDDGRTVSLVGAF
ncbi:PQQ-binding-like beta-propeller repeat protein [Kribbella karoonensis]|uniref:Pyrrolo-quinoline quinone repeat domain-containing protein n=1 Tax=Kribbella karoonensis TaxID=324851 RepID=A0ABN2D3T1_9ACTN